MPLPIAAKMLFEPERHQELSSDRWDEQFVRAARLNGIPTVAEQIGEAVDGNADNRCREFMFGAPGTAVASLAMWRETGDAIWAERFRRDICRLWSELRPCVDTDCLIWEQ